MYCVIPDISLFLYSFTTRYSCQYFHCIPPSGDSPHHLEWPGTIQPSPCSLSDMHPTIPNLSSTLYTPYHFCSLHPKCPFAPSRCHALCFFPSILLISVQMLLPLSPSPQLPYKHTSSFLHSASLLCCIFLWGTYHFLNYLLSISLFYGSSLLT